MRTAPRTTVESLIDAARAASRCREAARAPATAEERAALLRAAERYSARIAELASEICSGANG